MKHLRKAIAWANDRPLRERLLIGVTALVLTIAGGDLVLLQPLRGSELALQREIDALRNDLASRQAGFAVRLGELQEQEKQFGESALRQLSEEIARLQRSARSGALSTVSPTEMVAVLHEMFAADTAVRLTVVENAAPEPLIKFDTGLADREEPRPMLFKHPLTVEFTGSYAKVVEYLKRIEALDWHLMWEDFSIVMEQYPTARARIVLHTLSLEQGWVGA